MDDVKNKRGLLLVMIDIEPEHEADFNRWYEQEHFPERLNCPGFLSARRFMAVEGGPKYLAIFDLENPEVLESEAYKAILGPSEWTKRVESNFTSRVRNVYVEIPPGGPEAPTTKA